MAAPAGLFKFPRTHHVLDAGGTGVSRDDLLLDGADVARFVDGRTEVVRVRAWVRLSLGLRLRLRIRLRFRVAVRVRVRVRARVRVGLGAMALPGL